MVIINTSWNKVLKHFGMLNLIKQVYFTLFGELKATLVNEYLQRNIQLVHDNYDKYNLPRFDTYNDNKMLKINEWFKKNVRYVSDWDRIKKVEDWEDAIQDDGKGFLQSKKNGKYEMDCETGTTLQYAIARENRVSSEQLIFWAGRMTNGGHVALLYRADWDMDIYSMDWCYYPDPTKFEYRRKFKDLPWYVTEWFRTNDIVI